MNILKVEAAWQQKAMQSLKLLSYRPYGHPDTLCPNGVLWKDRAAENAWFKWSNKPWQLDFHNAGAWARQRMTMCANRVGKTTAAVHEDAFHTCGVYPDWWEGHRFNEPQLIWSCSISNEMSRDIAQDKLIGRDGKQGLIPPFRIKKKTNRQAGIVDVADTVEVWYGENFMDRVRGARDQFTVLQFKTYEQGVRAFYGRAVGKISLDEEPDPNNSKQRGIFSEILARLVDKRGLLTVTFTPLVGETEIVRHFLQSDRDQNIEGVAIYTGTWDDVAHLSPDAKAEALASFPEHERETRSKGVPLIGTGRVFLTGEDAIKVDPFPIPDHWFRICGHDFGLHHPAGSVWLAIDRDADTWYVYDCYKKANEMPAYHVSAMAARGNWIPISWPHDGMNGDKKDPTPLYKTYREEFRKFGGMSPMLSQSARYQNDTGGAQAIEPIMMKINERARTGRLKVFSHLADFFDEYRNLHRDDNGKIVARRDDLIKALCYAGMMQRYARQKTASFADDGGFYNSPMM